MGTSTSHGYVGQVAMSSPVTTTTAEEPVTNPNPSSSPNPKVSPSSSSSPTRSRSQSQSQSQTHDQMWVPGQEKGPGEGVMVNGNIGGTSGPVMSGNTGFGGAMSPTATSNNATQINGPSQTNNRTRANTVNAVPSTPTQLPSNPNHPSHSNYPNGPNISPVYPASADPHASPIATGPPNPPDTNGNANTNTYQHRKSTSSESIRLHADLFMQLIHEQRVLASQASLAEIASLRFQLEERTGEVEGLRAELDSMTRRHPQCRVASGASGASRSGVLVGVNSASASASSSTSTPNPPTTSPSMVVSASPPVIAFSDQVDPLVLQHELEKNRKQIESLKMAVEDGKAAKGELAALKVTVDALNSEYKGTRAELEVLRRENTQLKRRLSKSVVVVNSNNVTSGVRVKMEEDLEENIVNLNPDPNPDVEALRRRCEELERENEGLRKGEMFLRQRIEILESLSASTSSTLQSIDNLPDLSNELASLLGRQQANAYSAGLTEAHSKKRRLDHTQGG